MSTYQIRFHTVARGETVDGIARKYHMTSWKELYSAPCNAEFRRKRPKPELVQPGDKIGIPPDPRTILQAQLKSLVDLRAQSVQLFNQMQAQLDDDYKEFQHKNEKIDAGGAVFQLGLSQVTLVRDGYKAMALTGKKLAEAGHEMAKTWMRDRLNDLLGYVGGAMEITGEEGLGWAIGKILLKSWSDMQSGPYWLGRFKGDPEKIYQQAKAHIRSTRNSVLAGIDKRIAATRAAMSAKPS